MPNTPSYTSWLQLLRHLLPDTQKVVLFQLEQGHLKILASWPEGQVPERELVQAGQKAKTSGRLSLSQHGRDVALAHPLFSGERLWGVTVITATVQNRARLARSLAKIKWAEKWLPLCTVEQTPATEPLLYELLRARDLDEAANLLVNRLCHQLGADRVALASYGAKKTRILAISNTAEINRHTDDYRRLTRAMEESCLNRANSNISAPDIDKPELDAHRQLLRETGYKRVESLLLRSGEHTQGVITLMFQDRHTEGESAQRQLESLLPALAQWLALRTGGGNAGWVKQALRQNRRGLLWAAGGALLTLALILSLPFEYRIAGQAELEGSRKVSITAALDGYLESISARPGDTVQEGQILARLKQNDLQLERRQQVSELQQYRQEYNNALANGERAEAAIKSTQIEQAQARLALLDETLERTELSSPISGLLVSDDISQSLGRPVNRGDILFEVASTDGFRVVVYVDERDIAKVALEQEGSVALVSLPEQRFGFTVERITPVSSVRAGRNYFRVEAQLRAPSNLLRPGMTGTAKIRAGKRSLAWIWFHDIIDWLRLALWW